MTAAAVIALSLFAQAFSGTWTCHDGGFDVPWVIGGAPGASWTTVRWADQQSARGGIAYVGYIAPQKQWVYEDFHYDGSYSMNTSPGPADDTWTWSGTYYMGAQTLHGKVLWKLSSPQRIDRTFERSDGGKTTPTGSDYCTKVSP